MNNSIFIVVTGILFLAASCGQRQSFQRPDISSPSSDSYDSNGPITPIGAEKEPESSDAYEKEDDKIKKKPTEEEPEEQTEEEPEDEEQLPTKGEALPEQPKQEVNAAGEVVFRIKAGTGNGAWNSPDNPIVIQPGQTLRIYNDDAAQHTIHTNSQRGGYPVHGCGNFFNTRNIGPQGIACKFGNEIQQGMLPDSEIHDHFTWRRGAGTGQVYIKVGAP